MEWTTESGGLVGRVSLSNPGEVSLRELTVSYDLEEILRDWDWDGVIRPDGGEVELLDGQFTWSGDLSAEEDRMFSFRLIDGLSAEEVPVLPEPRMSGQSCGPPQTEVGSLDESQPSHKGASGHANEKNPGPTASQDASESYRPPEQRRSCTNFAYVSVGSAPTVIYRFYPFSGESENTGITIPSGLDAIGVGPDGNLYGISKNPFRLAIIDPQTSTVTYREIDGLTRNRSWSLGDFDAEGSLWIAGEAVESSAILDVNSDPVKVTSLPDPGYGGWYDWALNPADGRFYAADGRNGDLITVDSTSSPMKVVLKNNVWPTGSQYNGVFFGETGIMYAIDSNGNVQSLDLSDSTPEKPVTADKIGSTSKVGIVSGASQGATDAGGCILAKDFGDAPDSYMTSYSNDGPHHDELTGLTIGEAIDLEGDARHSILDDGSLGELDGTGDSDDGLDEVPAVQDRTYTIAPTVINSTGGPATLAAWSDMNQDGSFSEDERVIASVPNGTEGTVELNWNVLELPQENGTTHLRLRLYQGDRSDPTPNGLGGAGEVEDWPVEVRVPKADLSTVKTASGGPVAPGEEFDYTVTVSNAGPSSAQNVTAVDELPAGLSFVSGEGCSAEGRTVTCGPEESLASGSEKAWTFTVELDSAYIGDGSDLGNTASADSDTDDGSPDNDESEEADPPVIEPKADLSTVKTASGGAVAPGEEFDYTVTVSNAGPSSAQNVTAVDELPAGLSFVSGEGCSAEGRTVTCGPEESLASGSEKAWTFTVELDSAYTGDGSDLGNVASADSDTDDDNSDNDESDPVNPPDIEPKADLSTVKTASLGPVAPGEEFDYTVTVSNAGPSSAQNVKAIDDLPDGLTFVSGDDCNATGRTVTCGPVSLVEVGEQTSWTFTVELDSAYTGDGSDLGNTASADSDTDDGNPDNDESEKADPPVIEPKADLSTVKTASGGPVAPGEEFEYTVTVSNAGPSSAQNVSAVDELPSGLTFVSGEDCSAEGQTVTCANRASLATGSQTSWTFTAMLSPDYTGDGSDLGNTASADSDTDDGNPDNDESEEADPPDILPPNAHLQVTKTVDSGDGVTAGDEIDYTVTVGNLGPSTAADVKAIDQLPAPMAFTAGDGCAAEEQKVTCGPEATLPVGAQKSWTFTVQLDDAYTGDGSDLGNSVATDSSTDGDSDGTDPVFPIIKPNQVDLAVAHEADDRITHTGTITSTVVNYGPHPARGGVIEIEVPDGLTTAGDSVGADCDIQGGTAVCEFGEVLAPQGEAASPVVLAEAAHDEIQISIPVETASMCRVADERLSTSATVRTAEGHEDVDLSNNDDEDYAIVVEGGPGCDDGAAVLPTTGGSLTAAVVAAVGTVVLGLALMTVARTRRERRDVG
ncbi:GEVED domain-containing protein [Salininema proteolyticum]|uniref:GEVED domain-containing protein n=1 Tax=Salininema proteolyticum TaxID=1607685 RepID=A0ABV8TU12_9ACTN